MPEPANLVHEISATTGTGNFTVAAVNGKQRLSDVFGTGVTTNVFDYFISNRGAAEFEWGTGHMSGANTLVRDTVVGGSNGTSAVNFGAGTKDIANDVPAQFAAYSGAKRSSLTTRFGNTIVIGTDVDCDLTGTVANFHTALATAITAAQASNKEIRIPTGTPKLGGTVSFYDTDFKSLRIIGSGESTQITKSTATNYWIEIGHPAQARTINVQFEDMLFLGGTMTSGSVFRLRNTSDVKFINVPQKFVRQAYEMGVGASQINDVICTDLVDSPIWANSEGQPVILCGSGGILNIKGSGRHNGDGTAGLYFIEHTGATYNWDGMYLYDQFFEDFEKYINVAGGGIVNLTVTGGQMDRFLIAFDLQNLSGECRCWTIDGVQFLGGDRVAYWINGTGGIARDLTMTGCHHRDNTGAVDIVNGYANITGNSFIDSGQGGPLIKFAGKGVVTGNNSIATGAVAAHTYGIDWIGATDPDRSATGNEWTGASSGDENGTP